MFCVQCGNEVEQHARFCSKCGRDMVPAAVPRRTKHDMNLHINVLGWLFIGSGVLMGIGGLAAVLAGKLIQHLPIPVPPDVPFNMVHFAGGIAAIVGVAMLVVCCGVAAAGVGLLEYRSWGRVLAIVASVLMAVNFFPFGLVIAIYAFWVLFSQEGQEHYKARSAATIAEWNNAAST